MPNIFSTVHNKSQTDDILEVSPRPGSLLIGGNRLIGVMLLSAMMGSGERYISLSDEVETARSKLVLCARSPVFSKCSKNGRTPKRIYQSFYSMGRE
ncbi:hypothetical protein CEXT_244361 [Caerostris extrusa]|uniref:Uncharacterized protein n=1 Tax=Caerostris extrusa TaxID=172846 RepID=A0AAV4T210_CAEEX|nr:hypothetical protein CEXT_244361 [Caerostris extrusa]